MPSTQVKSLAEQKRELLERSQQCRSAVVADCTELGASLAWVPRTIQIVRTISPLLLVVAPLAGWIARKKMRDGKAKPFKGETLDRNKKTGLVAAVWRGFRLYQQAAPFIQGFMKAWPSKRSARTEEAEPRGTPHTRQDSR